MSILELAFPPLVSYDIRHTNRNVLFQLLVNFKSFHLTEARHQKEQEQPPAQVSVPPAPKPVSKPAAKPTPKATSTTPTPNLPTPKPLVTKIQEPSRLIVKMKGGKVTTNRPSPTPSRPSISVAIPSTPADSIVAQTPTTKTHIKKEASFGGRVTDIPPSGKSAKRPRPEKNGANGEESPYVAKRPKLESKNSVHLGTSDRKRLIVTLRSPNLKKILSRLSSSVYDFPGTDDAFRGAETAHYLSSSPELSKSSLPNSSSKPPRRPLPSAAPATSPPPVSAPPNQLSTPSIAAETTPAPKRNIIKIIKKPAPQPR
jgi:hypothetical protein